MPRNRTTLPDLSHLYIAGFGDGPFVVYQLLDGQGRPIYIGQTNNLERRLIEHATTKPWFNEVVSVWCEPVKYRNGFYPHYPSVYEVERKRIRQFNPRYNQKTGRIPKFTIPTVGMSLVISVEHRDQLAATAKAYGVGPADIVRQAITEWFDRNPLPEEEEECA